MLLLGEVHTKKKVNLLVCFKSKNEEKLGIILTAKQAVSPGTINCICPDTAFSDTPDSNQVKLSSLHAVLMANLASKLSTQLNVRSTGPPFKPLVLKLILLIIFSCVQKIHLL